MQESRESMPASQESWEFPGYPASSELKEFQEHLKYFLAGWTDFMPVFMERPPTTYEIATRKILSQFAGDDKPDFVKERMREFNKYRLHATPTTLPSDYEPLIGPNDTPTL